MGLVILHFARVMTRSKYRKQDSPLSRELAKSGRFSTEFALFCDAQVFVKAMKAGEVVALNAVEEAGLGEIDIAKTQERSKWQALAESFEFSTEVELAPIETAFYGHTGFPVGISVVLFHENLD